MFNSKPSTSKSGLEDAINNLLSEMAGYDAHSEAYAQMADQLVKLYELKEVDHKVDSGRRPSADTLAIVGGNIFGIAMIVLYEQRGVLTSKALPLLMKLK